MKFNVLCRWCGHDFFVLAFRNVGQDVWMPDYCARCQSDDLVALRDLSQAEQEEIERVVAERKAGPDLVWRWATVADPNRPRKGSWADPLGRWGARIPHPLADRVGEEVRELCRGQNGNRLLEFVSDGLRVVAPRYAAGRPR